MGARPGLACQDADKARTASKLAAVRLTAYKAALALLSVQEQQGGGSEAGAEGGEAAAGGGGAPPQLTERQAAALVSVLDAELPSNEGAGNLLEVR